MKSTNKKIKKIIDIDSKIIHIHGTSAEKAEMLLKMFKNTKK